MSRKVVEQKIRPFPWPCSNCCTLTVFPTVIDYTARVKQDGVVQELHLPNLEVPRCRTCGETVITSAVDARINDALRSRLRLLAPAQIRKGIAQLGLQQRELADRIGVAPETISRWLNGALIQSRAMDNLLRVYFALPEVRNVLCGESQDAQLGTQVGLSAGNGEDRTAGKAGASPTARRKAKPKTKARAKQAK